MYRYIDIQRDDENGGDIFMYLPDSIIDYFGGITERLGLINGRLRRILLARR
jgi:hypothetical protein